MIRKATIKDIPEIMALTKACAKVMAAQNIFQWNEHYPNEGAFKQDVVRGELYVLETGKTIAGCITVSKFMDKVYVPVLWLTLNKNNLYIHRLAVHPKFQGQGHAQNLMQFAENYARENNFVSVRLDTFSQNKRNQKFYELRSYKKLGDVYFPEQSEHPFHCYELVL